MRTQAPETGIPCRLRDATNRQCPRPDSESTHAGAVRADNGTGARRANLGEGSRTEFWLALGHAQRSPVPTRNSSPPRGRKAAVPLLRPAWGGPVPGPVVRTAIDTTRDVVCGDSESTQARRVDRGNPTTSVPSEIFRDRVSIASREVANTRPHPNLKVALSGRHDGFVRTHAAIPDRSGFSDPPRRGERRSDRRNVPDMERTGRRVAARFSIRPEPERNQQENSSGQGSSARQSGTEEAESRQAIRCIGRATASGAADAAIPKRQAAGHMRLDRTTGGTADPPGGAQ